MITRVARMHRGPQPSFRPATLPSAAQGFGPAGDGDGTGDVAFDALLDARGRDG
jgi:hypothetical protein